MAAGGAVRGALRDLAVACGLQLGYTDGLKRRRAADAEAVMAVLRALGHPIDMPEQAPGLLRARSEAERSRLIEPVTVAWMGEPASVRVRPVRPGATAELNFSLEDGGELRHEAALTPSSNGRADGRVAVPLPAGLPPGIHTLRVAAAGESGVTTLLVAPPRCYEGGPGEPASLGVFLPLYALRSRRSLGIADLTDLSHLSEWAGAAGCSLVGTLPLLACNLDEPFEPSPYSPITRLFWNELYADLESAPELPRSGRARAILSSEEFQREAAALRRRRLVDYRRAATLKRGLLAALADAAFESPERGRELEDAARRDPVLDRFARFRAAVRARRAPWTRWPPRLRDGRLEAGDYDEREYRVELYAQSLLRDQLGALARSCPAGLYLDLPIGVNAGGFDVWNRRDQFATGVSVGAPPDQLFSKGQEWGFPPPQPEAARAAGYDYFIAVIRNHLRYTRVLRVDHVIGFHRLFWIPAGMEGSRGVFVRYPADEIYAILSIESHRHKARLVGENLGTVPPEVTRTLKQRGVLGMSIGQFEFKSDRDAPPPRGARGTLGALNTHDTPTFAAFWNALDAADRRRLGIVNDAEERREVRDRERMRRAVFRAMRRRGLVPPRAATADVLAALLRLLAAGPSQIALVNLEDLWLETSPQNVPGVGADRYPVWRRRAARTLEQVRRDPALRLLLVELAGLRKEGGLTQGPGVRRGRAKAGVT